MAGIIRDEDFRLDVGRASGGKTFVRVVHEPTQKSRHVMGLNGRPCGEVVEQLRSEVVQDLEAAGWRRPEERKKRKARKV